MRANPASLAVLFVPLLVAGGVAGGLAVRPAEAPRDLAPAVAALSAPVTAETFDDPRQAVVRFTVGPSSAVTTTASGRVTKSACAVGRPLSSGTALAQLNGVPVLALATATPLYRDLAEGTKGDDVRALQRELGRLGYEVDATGSYAGATASAVRELKKKSGFAAPDGNLALSQVAWLPQPTVTPATCEASLGASIAPGGTLATMAGSLQRIAFVRPEGMVAGPRTFDLWGLRTQVTGDTIEDAAYLRQVAATKEFAAAQKAGDDQQVMASVALAKPLQAVKVPPAALFDLKGDAACVQVGDRAVGVKVVGSGLGASLVVAPETFDAVRIGSGITHDHCDGAA